MEEPESSEDNVKEKISLLTGRGRVQKNEETADLSSKSSSHLISPSVHNMSDVQPESSENISMDPKISPKVESGSLSNNTCTPSELLEQSDINSLTEYSNNIPELSIPSLNLRSLSKTESEGSKSFLSNNTNNSSLTLQESPIGSKSNSNNQSPFNSNEEEQNLSSFNQVDQSPGKLSYKDDAGNISNESSIHTQFDWTDVSESSKSLSVNVNSKSDQVESSNKSASKLSSGKKKSPRRISQLYPDALSTDPPLCLNTEKAGGKANVAKSSKESSTSEEIIKLDIRGQATANRHFPCLGNILFPNFETIPKPVQENEFIAISDRVVDITSLGSKFPQFNKKSQDPNTSIFDLPSKVLIHNTAGDPDDGRNVFCHTGSDSKSGAADYEQDCAVEELILNESRDIFPSTDKDENIFMQGNKPSIEPESSLSTVTTEYKTFREDFHHKIPDFQTYILDKDKLVDDLRVSLQRSEDYREQLQLHNEHLTSELGTLQQLLSDTNSQGGEMKGQLSDFVKHQNLLREDDLENFPLTLKLYEKMDTDTENNDNLLKKSLQDINDKIVNNEAVTEDIDFNLTRFTKPTDLFFNELNKLNDEFDPDNFKLTDVYKEKLLSIVCKELQIKFDEFHSNKNSAWSKLNTEKITSEIEKARLRDTLISLKSDNPQITKLQFELETKHHDEMEELRTYFEKKCADMEKHYSEEVFSQQSRKVSADSSTDSLINCPEAMAFSSPMHGAGDGGSRFGSRMQRSQSAEFHLGVDEPLYLEEKLKNLKDKHRAQIKIITSKHEMDINEMAVYHETYLAGIEDNYKEQIADLKAHLQTLQNTEIHNELLSFEHRDADLELEKDKNLVADEQVPLEVTNTSLKSHRDVTEVLQSDPNAELNNWPVELVSLRDKIQANTQLEIVQLKMTHAEELSALRSENSKELVLLTEKHKIEAEKWKQKRNEAFDKNRHLEEVLKERDGLKHMTQTLQRVLSQLVEYFNLCEDELNNTFVGELLKQIVAADENFDNTIVLSSFSTVDKDADFRSASFNNSRESFDPNATTLSQISKNTRMHFAPNVNGIMTFIDSDSILDCLDQSQDISVNFKHDLDSCLKRLRTEAQELLLMSTRIVPKRLSILSADDQKAAEVCGESNPNTSEIPFEVIAEHKKLLLNFDELQELFKKSEMSRKELEESLAQSMYQEVVLKGELEMAMDKIAELVNDNPLDHTREIVSEGYGVVTHPRTPVSLPPHPRVAITSPPPLLGSEGNTPEGRSLSMDAAVDRRTPAIHELVRRLMGELEVVTKERDDMHMQVSKPSEELHKICCEKLEAANKQLRSTRQFLDEQAAEREQERDEFQKELERLKDDNSKLLSKTQHHIRICKEVEQLEQQMRDMTVMIGDLETQRNNAETELISSQEKIVLLRDIIGNLESQLETKTVTEVEVLKDLESFKLLAEEREQKMLDLSEELQILKKELASRVADDVLAAGAKNIKDSNLTGDLETEKILAEKMRSELHTLVGIIAERTAALENLHEAVCSQSCSSPSEDVSIRDHKKKDTKEHCQSKTPTSPEKRISQLPLMEVSQLGDSLHRHLKAEDAALKRIRDLEMQLVQLKDVAQELRTERDILQERMSEQSLRISSLQSRLDRTRHTAEAMRHQSTEDLRLQLDEALSQTQLLREALDSRDKQVARLKALVESTKKRLGDQEQELSVCAGSSKETIQRYKREVRDHQNTIRELQEALDARCLHHESMPALLESVVADKNADIDLLRQQLLEKERHLQAVLSLRLDDEQLKQLTNNSEKDINNEGKLSARTLSDILSISEFDEPDLIMRKMEIRPESLLSGQLMISRDNTKEQNITLLPEIDNVIPMAESYGLQATQDGNTSPHFCKNESHLSEKNSNAAKMQNVSQELGESSPQVALLKENESTVGILSHPDSAKQISNIALSENCSMFPNKDASDTKDISIQPKKINFSGSSSLNNNSKKDFEGDASSKIRADNATSVLGEQTKNDKVKSLDELGLQIDVDQNVFPDILTQLKYEIVVLRKELENKSTSLKIAEEQLAEFPIVKNKMEDLKVVLQNSLKTMQEDKQYYSNQLDKFVNGEQILKRKLEETIYDVNEKSRELKTLKEDIVRRENIVLELAKEKRSLQNKLSEMENKENMFENSSLENIHLKEKVTELSKLEQLISEKNLQIDNLNQNLDKLDDLQRQLAENESQIKTLKSELNEKYVKIDYLEKDNQSLQNNEEVFKEKNSDLLLKLNSFSDKNRQLETENIKYKDDLTKMEKEFENILQREKHENESQLKSQHEEDSETEVKIKLEEFKLLLSELDSPKSAQERYSPSHGKGHTQLEKIRQQISCLKSELHQKRKELTLKVLELEQARHEIVDLQMQTEHFKNLASENERTLQHVDMEKEELLAQLRAVTVKMREEGNVEDLRSKLHQKTEECLELEHNGAMLREIIEGSQRETHFGKERDNRLQELSVENGRLKQQLISFENRLTDQENLIRELNGVRENLMTDLQSLEQRSEEDKDTSLRLQMLLDTEKQMSSNIQCQDSNVIQILRGRLEVAIDSESELQMLLERERLTSEQLHKQLDMLKKQLEHLQASSGGNEVMDDNRTGLQEKLDTVTGQLEDQMEISELLKSEVMLLKTKFDREKSRLVDLQNVLDREKLWFQKEVDANKEQLKALKEELTESKRQKHEMHLELVHSREKLHLQKNEILILEKRLQALQESQKSTSKSESYRALLGEMENQKTSLNIEVSTLKHNLKEAAEREKNLHVLLAAEGKGGRGMDDANLTTLHHLEEMQNLLRRHITENVQMSETVKELTIERRELQARVRQLENQLKMGGKHAVSMTCLPEGVDQQVRYLYGRYMRVDSYRKALLWQKRYLMGIAAELDVWQVRLGDPARPLRSRGWRRFRCVAVAVTVIFRMKYLVRRWHTGNRLGANIHLSVPNVYPTELRTSKSYSHVPISRDKPEMLSRRSLNNPVPMYENPSSKPSNKSWSLGSAGASSRADRDASRHPGRKSAPFTSASGPSSSLYRSANLYRDTLGGSDQWHPRVESPRMHSEITELPCEDNYTIRSSTSDHEASPILSRYMNRLDQLNVKLHRALNTPRDPI